MRPKHVRDLVTLATFVAMWLVAPRAFASDALTSSLSLASIATFGAAASEPEPEPVRSREVSTAPAAPPPDARRAAPVCDPRGATMFAPAPQLQDPEQSLDVDGCADAEAFAALLRDGHQVGRGRAPAGDGELHSQEPMIGSHALPIGRGEGVRVPAPEAARSWRLPGHRTTLDRPPRA